MTDEYKMLRKESEESIAKQDTLTNIVFTVLSASSFYSTVAKNIPFIILAEFISAVLLARILHYRHVMLYISTYLEQIEKASENSDTKWESRLQSFHSKIPQKYSQWNLIKKILWKVVNLARGTKHLGNLILSIFLFSPIIPQLNGLFSISDSHLIIDYEILLALIALILNITFSLGICFLYKLRPGYISVWENVIPPETN